MVHVRLNEREPNPNKHINFITPLPAPEIPSPYSEDDARQLLRALAAQVRPIMKSHGFAVNSFEEYEYNRVFAGRNWNNGETVELVLRRADGTFVSVPWLLGTLCHELAHIKHMNHGRDFQRLWAQLRMEVRALQERGYFGDGYWSSGTRISDSLRVGGEGVEDYDLPEYVCGGAQTRSRPKSLSRRRRIQRRVVGPSPHTGAQTEKRRKPGTRVKAKGAFKGEGRALNEGISDEEVRNKGTGFRKQAGSKRAREERALAAERRLKALKGVLPKEEDTKPSPDDESVTESDSEYDSQVLNEPVETDEARRQGLRNSMKNDGGDQELMRSQQFMRDFLSGSGSTSRGPKESLNGKDFASIFDAIEVSDSEEETSCAIPSTSNPVNPRHRSRSPGGDTRSTKRHRQSSPPRPGPSQAGTSRPSTKSKQTQPLGIGRIVQEEMSTRKKEALGLTGGGKKLGSSPTSFQSRKNETEVPLRRSPPTSRRKDGEDDSTEWSCLVCTLDNLPTHLACSACGTPRGENQWPHR